MNIDLTNKNALVGGASKGIGFAAAKQLASLGANVTLISRSREHLDEGIKKLDTAKGQTHHTIIADYSDHAAAIEAIKSSFVGTPHILVHNSGGPPAGAVTDLTIADYQKGFDMHFTTTHELTKWALPMMKKAKYGRIINVLSVSVKQPINELPVSNMIRAGISNWAKTLSNAVAGDGITVNNVLPGYTLTERMSYVFEQRAETANVSIDAITEKLTALVPAARFADPDEIGSVIAFLASPAASYINGVNLPVDGGFIKSS